jgi:hypothetical protein
MPILALSVNGSITSIGWAPTTRRNEVYIGGVISFTPVVQLAQQVRQFEEVLRPEVGPSSGQHDEWLWRNDVRPGRWQRANLSLSGLSEEHAVLAPGVGKANHLVFTPAQRMEWVRYTESSRIAATAGS